MMLIIFSQTKPRSVGNQLHLPRRPKLSERFSNTQQDEVGVRRASGEVSEAPLPRNMTASSKVRPGRKSGDYSVLPGALNRRRCAPEQSYYCVRSTHSGAAKWCAFG